MIYQFDDSKHDVFRAGVDKFGGMVSLFLPKNAPLKTIRAAKALVNFQLDACGLHAHMERLGWHRASPPTAERKTTPSRCTPKGVEVTDAMVEAACAAGCKVDDPSFEWPGDYSPTEQATGRKCVRAALEAALSVLPTPPIMEGETHD